MFNLFVTAYAAAAGGAGAQGGGTSTILMIVIMIAIFYFLLIRPENKRKKEAENMRSSLKKGDWITTIGGIYGKVVTINERTVVIETSEDRVRMEFLKSAVGQVGTLDQQAAAQQSAGMFGKKKKSSSEEVVADFDAQETVEVPAAEEPKDAE